jgi:ribosomal protein S18 acetylase RimI-like enzyme
LEHRKISKLEFARIVSFHCGGLARANYPCQLEVESLFTQQDKWNCVEVSPVEKLCFLRDRNLPVADLQFPLLKYLTVFSDENEGQLEEAAHEFSKLGGKVLLLVESYNPGALQLLEKFIYTETFYCQQKLLGNLHKIRPAKSSLPGNVKIRNFVVGRDEGRYMDFYNKVLGFLIGGTIDMSFIENIIARRSFDPAGYFLAVSNGLTVGFLNVEIEPWGQTGSGFAYIYQIGVDNDWQGTGLASTLLVKARDFALLKGCDRIGVGVRMSNIQAVNFFMKHGFKEAYRVTGYLLESN